MGVQLSTKQRWFAWLYGTGTVGAGRAGGGATLHIPVREDDELVEEAQEARMQDGSVTGQGRS